MLNTQSSQHTSPRISFWFSLSVFDRTRDLEVSNALFVSKFSASLQLTEELGSDLGSDFFAYFLRSMLINLREVSRFFVVNEPFSRLPVVMNIIYCS